MHAIVVGNALLQSISYSIVKIEDEKIPLYSAPKGTYYFPAMAGMVVLIVLVALTIYLFKCEKYRRRIKELDTQGADQPGWELWKLKGTVRELEMQKTDDLIGEIKKQLV